MEENNDKNKTCSVLSSTYNGRPYFINADGQHVVTKCWEVQGGDKVIRAILLICHDVAEHCLRYEAFAEEIVHRRIQVYSHDHVGHGGSEGVAVDILDFKTYVRDTLQHIDIIRQIHSYAKIFILGHGMGGTIAIKAVLSRPKEFAGCVLIGPAITPTPDQASAFSQFIDKTAASFAPLFGVTKIDPDSLSSHPKEIVDYIQDPLVYHGRLRARHCVIFMEAMEELERKIYSIDWPFFVLHGERDKRCSLEGSKLLFEKIYPDQRHSLHHEAPEKAEVVKGDIVAWLVKRI
ncbi:monoglyceride lipase-like isoform X2 [Antedon mediterranea]|uniref:monoglyceride lipase-like isoform X2 n=1 Tax=Antedon mediterranea TaxID=105859 RepID=UPI003AF9A91B